MAWSGPSHSLKANGKLKLAITTTILGGWEALKPWHAHYSKSGLELEFLIYINASVAPLEFVRNCESLGNVHLIAWDFPYSRFKHHYLSTYKGGHAQPAAIADAKFRALSVGCSHLLPIDMDEFIHPIESMATGLTSNPCYFLSSFAKNTGNDIGVTPSSIHSNAKSSQNHPTNQLGSSGVRNKHAYGKCISPIRWDAHIPDIHCSGISEPQELDIHSSAVMLHFIEQEGQRKVPSTMPMTAVQSTNFTEFILDHRKLSDDETFRYALTAPVKIV